MKNLTLTPFNEDNAPTVLAWRNSERVRLNMIDNSIISEQDHYAFLQSLKGNTAKAYYLVKLDRNPIGSISFVDMDSKTPAWGCHLGTEKLIPGLFPALVFIAAQHIFITTAAEVLKSEVAAHNNNPISLNKFIGIPLITSLEKTTTKGDTVLFHQYELAKTDLNTVSDKLLKILPSSMRQAAQNFTIDTQST